MLGVPSPLTPGSDPPNLSDSPGIALPGAAGPRSSCEIGPNGYSQRLPRGLPVGVGPLFSVHAMKEKYRGTFLSGLRQGFLDGQHRHPAR